MGIYKQFSISNGPLGIVKGSREIEYRGEMPLFCLFKRRFRKKRGLEAKTDPKMSSTSGLRTILTTSLFISIHSDMYMDFKKVILRRVFTRV